MIRQNNSPTIRTQMLSLGLCLLVTLGFTTGCSTNSAKKNNVTIIQLPNQGEQIAAAQNLAIRAQKEKDNESAILLYSQAVETYEDLPAAWNNMGVLLLTEGRLMEAAEAFGSAAIRTPNDPRPSFNLGLTWDRAGYLETALEHYSNALSLDERYLPALRGAIKAETRLGESSPILVDRIRTALFLEQDPQWLEYLELQKSWAESEVRAKVGLPTAGVSR